MVGLPGETRVGFTEADHDRHRLPEGLPENISDPGREGDAVFRAGFGFAFDNDLIAVQANTQSLDLRLNGYLLPPVKHTLVERVAESDFPGRTWIVLPLLDFVGADHL